MAGRALAVDPPRPPDEPVIESLAVVSQVTVQPDVSVIAIKVAADSLIGCQWRVTLAGPGTPPTATAAVSAGDRRHPRRPYPNPSPATSSVLVSDRTGGEPVAAQTRTDLPAHDAHGPEPRRAAPRRDVDPP